MVQAVNGATAAGGGRGEVPAPPALSPPALSPAGSPSLVGVAERALGALWLTPPPGHVIAPVLHRVTPPSPRATGPPTAADYLPLRTLGEGCMGKVCPHAPATPRHAQAHPHASWA
jgi:hypothetical protein